MTKQKIQDTELEDRIEEILALENRSMSISEIVKQLGERFEIKRSPQVVLRHLVSLKKKRKVVE